MRGLLPARVITVKVIELQKLLLDTWKFFRPFLNTLTADDKYYLISKDNSMQTNQMLLSQKQKIFSQIFSDIFKKTWPSKLLYFSNYRHWRRCLDKCLKAPVWEDPSTGDMVNGPKCWFNLHGSTFTILIDHCEGNWVGKNYS